MVVFVLTVPGRPQVLRAQVAFHLAAGADLVLVPAASSDELTDSDRGSSDGRVAVFGAGGWEETAGAHGATWVIEAEPGEFWWPRGGSLADVLRRVPEAVDAVQGLERRLVIGPGDGSLLERATLRLVPPAPAVDAELPDRRPRLIRRFGVERSDPTVVRAWFPVEVLCVPLDGGVNGEGSPRPEATCVEDTRLRDVFSRLAEGKPLVFSRPTATADPAFGVEVAGLFEAELVETSAALGRLEARVAILERSPRKRVVARLRRLAGRARRWRGRG